MVGWIKLYRDLVEDDMWLCEPFTKGQAWVDLLMMANYKDGEFYHGNSSEIIKRGSFATSELKLMNRWKWSKNKVRNFLKLLENKKMIACDKNRIRTTITIVNYCTFQDLQTTDEPQVNHERTTDEPLMNHKRTAESTQYKKVRKEEEKESKKGKNEEKKSKKEKADDIPQPPYYPNDEKLDNAFCEYLEYRKRIKKPLLTKSGFTRAFNDLEKASTVNGVMDNDLAVKVIEQSIFKCYVGLFPLKDMQGNNYQKTKSKTNSDDEYWAELERRAMENDRRNIESGAMNIDGTWNRTNN